MKKKSLLVAIVAMFLTVVVLSWIIPIGSFANGTYTASEVNPVGIVNLFRLPVMTVQTFIQYALVFLSIGALYGVLNKTGVYDNIVKGIAKKWKGKEKFLLVLVSVIFALIGSLTGLSTWAFLFVPFVAAILLVAGHKKINVMLATIGALLVGEAASIIGFSGAGYIVNIFSVAMSKEIVTRIILFILLTGLYVFYIARHAELEKTKNEDIPLLAEDKQNKKSKMPLIVISIAFAIFTFIAMYNWYYGLGVQVFNNLDTKLNSYAIISKLLTGSTALGYWGNYEFTVAILVITFVIGWLYNVKLADLFDGMADGIKKIAKVALYATLCNVVFTVMLSNDAGNMYATIVNHIADAKQTFSIPYASLATAAGSVFFNDFYYLLYYAATYFTGFEAVYYPILGVLITGLYGIMMMVLPTSIMLVAGLKYFNVSYLEWLKKMWLYFVEALVVLFLVVIIVVIII